METWLSSAGRRRDRAATKELALASDSGERRFVSSAGNSRNKLDKDCREINSQLTVDTFVGFIFYRIRTFSRITDFHPPSTPIIKLIMSVLVRGSADILDKNINRRWQAVGPDFRRFCYGTIDNWTP
jgi:hypothetical protein